MHASPRAGTDQQLPGSPLLACRTAGVVGFRDLSSNPSSVTEHPSDLGKVTSLTSVSSTSNGDDELEKVRTYSGANDKYSTERSLNQKGNVSAHEIEEHETVSW